MSDTAGALPIYLQISELLIRDIAAGRLPDGTRLPPERQMARELGVAVGTLRRALAALVEKGLLERVQGSGNYIRDRAAGRAESIYAMFRLELVEGGGLPTAEVLDVTRCPKPVELPRFGTAADGHRIRRLRRLSGRPAAIEEIWLDGRYCDALEPGALSQSLYLHYRRELGLWIQRAEDWVGVGPVPVWAPGTFAPAPGVSVGHVLRIAWAQDNSRAEVSQTWFDPDIARYVARLS